MSHPRIGRSSSSLVIEPARKRQTPRPRNAFDTILKGGAQVLLSGARAATKVVGLPVISAAISGAQLGAGSAAPTTAPSGQSAADLTRSLQTQRYDEDLQLLALQDQIQRHNRQVALVSNVMKSRHDTAKAAINNMRS